MRVVVFSALVCALARPPRTSTRTTVATRASSPLAPGAGALFAWTPEPLDSAGAASCLRDITSNGTTLFAVGEGGVVLRGAVGAGLAAVLDLGYPYYFYGVAVVVASAARSRVVVTGFADGGALSQGVALASLDPRGDAWGAPANVSGGTWLGGPIASVPLGGGAARLVVASATEAPVWTADVPAAAPDPVAARWERVAAGAGWHAGPLVADAASVVVAGFELCASRDAAASFACGTAVDADGDGGVARDARNASRMLVGGGEIAPAARGWVHASADGGRSWGSARALDAPYPIRFVAFLGAACGRDVAIAAGGDYFAGLGGVYASTDGGRSWALELDTGREMASCATGPGFVTCVGSAQGQASVAVTARC